MNKTERDWKSLKIKFWWFVGFVVFMAVAS